MSNKSYKIRKAKPTDVVLLLKMFEEYLREVDPNKKLPPANETDTIRWLLEVIDVGGAWVAISDRTIVGSIGCGVDRYGWNSKALYVYDRWYYVKPSYRKGYDISKKLIEVARDTADEAGFPFVFSVNSGKDERIDRFVTMQDFEYRGGNFLHVPKR